MTDATVWAVQRCTIASDGSVLTLTATADNPRIWQNTLASGATGKTYIATCVVESEVGASIVFGSTAGASNYGQINLELGVNTFRFTATSDALWVHYYDYGINSIGETSSLSKFSVKEITATPQSLITYSTDRKVFEALTSDGSLNGLLPTALTYTQAESFSQSTQVSTIVTANDLAILNKNPEEIVAVALGKTPTDLSFATANILSMYGGNEGVEGNKPTVIHNIMEAGIEQITNPSFDTDTSSWTGYNATLAWETGGAVRITSTGVAANIQQDIADISTAGAFIEFTVNVTENAGASTVSLFLNGDTISLPLGSEVKEYKYIYKVVSSVTIVQVRTGSTSGDIVITTISAKIITPAEIINYTSNCRTNLLNTSYGATNFKFKQDASGKVTDMADAETIVASDDGRNFTIPLATPFDYTANTKDISSVEAIDDTSATITFSDTSTLVIP